jgi:hypothetical protein
MFAGMRAVAACAISWVVSASALERVARGVASSFAAAADAVGVEEDRYVIAGHVVALRFAGPELRARLTRAFAHLAAPPGDESEPLLTVRLWDTASTGAPRPPFPATASGGEEGAFYHLHEPPVRAAYRPGLGTLAVLDERGEAWYWVADAAEQAAWEEVYPLRQILFWWLEPLGFVQVHGAAVGTSERGVLVVGPPGSGKSTVAFAALGSSLFYAGDDYVAVATGDPPRVAGIYCSGRLDRAHLGERFPAVAPLVSDGLPETEKAVLYVHEHFPERTTAGFPLAAILVAARHAGPGTRVRPTSRAAAFAALAPTTLFQLHTGGEAELAALSRLIARVPCHALDVGSDVAAIPAAILELLAPA